MPSDNDTIKQLTSLLQKWSCEAGFQQIGITDIDLSAYKSHYEHWIKANYHGDMQYMQRHLEKRLNPSLLVDGALRVISFRMDYLPSDDQRQQMPEIIASSNKAYISRYALGRDYHKLIRKRLANIAKKIEVFAEQSLNQRPFVDSAPILERAFAEKAGLGWIGKNTMLINKNAGSYFFLGEIITSIPLTIDSPSNYLHCGSCDACLTSCPTNAFQGAHILDARRCISYLTIELQGSIPLKLRPLIGNRVYGCDDCQIACPWNKFNQPTQEVDFSPRHNLDDIQLLTLFNWSENEFLKNTEGSPIRRIGYQRWIRNMAVGLGNAKHDGHIIKDLNTRLQDATLDSMAKEHIQWAINEQMKK